MRKFLAIILAAGGMLLFNPLGAAALPVNGSIQSDSVKLQSPVQQARLYCYNRYTGRFLHWGPCGGYGYYRPHYYHPYHYYHRHYYHPYRYYHRYHYYRPYHYHYYRPYYHHYHRWHRHYW
ncbi:hypothetical protein [Methylocystis heyeri]|uniref:VrrB protein n=1 Tax=Methylocystis heyeri TaxID=391905 RepID=A0A6B8KAS9_9HYPH|nr:hypothetical protein [Methylocystis heyeri]QGM44602.1 hypothetical protein H2LOC_002245 [Methylocystis heyeri]